MDDVASALCRLPPLEGVPVEAVRAASSQWRVLTLSAGEPLWVAGAAVDELAVLLSGELVGTEEEAEVARIQPGELIGEVSAFFAGQTRSLTLSASVRSVVATLPVPGLRTLRWLRSPVYTALLAHAVQTIAGRLRAVDRRIALLAEGAEDAPRRADPSVLARLWTQLVEEVDTGQPPDPFQVLRRLPGLRGQDARLVLALSDAFTASPLRVGQILCLEGERGSRAWIVAQGKVDVLRLVHDDRAERLATLGPGEAAGLLALVDDEPRTASCVGSAPGWVLGVDREALHALPPEVRLLWHESLVAALGGYLRGANHTLARLIGQAGRVASVGWAAEGTAAALPLSVASNPTFNPDEEPP